jgi:hypothetical protein
MSIKEEYSKECKTNNIKIKSLKLKINYKIKKR